MNNIFSMWTVYERPSDYPEMYVARRFELDKPTEDLITSPSIEFLRQQMQMKGLVKMSRNQEDEPHVLEVWL